VNYLRHRNGLKGLSRGDGGDTFTSPLKRMCLLLDARHGLKEIDRRFLKVIYDKKYSVIKVPDNIKVPDEQGRISASSPSMRDVDMQRVGRKGDVAAQVADPPKLQIVLTKCDLVDRLDLVRRVEALREELNEILPPAAGRLPVVMVSALEDKGICELQRELAALCPQEER
jgi:GTP-binding protein EngB required for normal cell division